MIDDELQQWFEHTEDLITALIEDGTNEEVHHTIEHHFSCVDFEVLEKAAVAAFKQGLAVEEPEEAEQKSRGGFSRERGEGKRRGGAT